MSYHLPRIVGTSVAADWMLTGRTVSAEEAERRGGLVSEVVDADRLFRACARDRDHHRRAVHPGRQLTKRALQANTDAPDLAVAMELENRNQVLSHATEDAAARRQKWS